MKESALRAQINAPLFSFFLLCATQSKRRKRERERAKREQTNTPFFTLSLFLFLRASLRETLSLPSSGACGFPVLLRPSSFFPKVKCLSPIFLHHKASYLGCRFKFPYSREVLFSGLVRVPFYHSRRSIRGTLFQAFLDR